MEKMVWILRGGDFENNSISGNFGNRCKSYKSVRIYKICSDFCSYQKFISPDEVKKEALSIVYTEGVTLHLKKVVNDLVKVVDDLMRIFS